MTNSAEPAATVGTIERDGDAVYLWDVDGTPYRVLDAVMRKGVMVAANPPKSWATYRVFRPKQGQRRLHTFQPGESREPTADRLTTQLRTAAFMSASPIEDRRNLDPR